MTVTAAQFDHAALAKVLELARSRDEHVVTGEEAVEALGDIEPSPDAIDSLREVLAAEGVTLDDSVEEIHVIADDPELADLDDELVERRHRARYRPNTRQNLKAAMATGTSDTVRMYMREIGRVPLLIAAEEVQLAKQIERGGHAAERLADLAAAGGLEEVDDSERRVLQRNVRKGEAAKAELTQANLRLVVSIAKRYMNHSGMQLLDLVQEGNLGLMRAVEKFDWRKGFKFSTYATWWIRQSITRAIADQSRTIRIPVHMVEQINRIHRTQREMEQQLERRPTDEELAARLELPVEKVVELLRVSLDPLSLDSPASSEDDDRTLSDTIADEQFEEPIDAATRVLLLEAIDDALDGLNERERELVRMRFGLDDGQPRTLEDVGREFGVTRERVRQIEMKTLAKLRNPNSGNRLREYFDVD